MPPVRRAPQSEAEQDADEDAEGRDEVTVTVLLTVTEQVTYEFEAELKLPARTVDDPEALRDYLDLNEEVWLDHLDPTGASGCLSVNERSLDEASVVLAV
ncbi:hypothetical protein [Streptomyces sp. NPDC002133]|uniref:hypothetical protein n=1 Tax=Streptomyces sp. NPDC002133 TaxID=3154409 RepID=UPI0033242312